MRKGWIRHLRILAFLIRGEQNLSIDIVMKFSRMIGTTVSYWLNLQNAYDVLIAEFRETDLRLIVSK